MKVKRAMILLLIIGIIVVGGCVRYPDGHNGNGEAIYQLEIIVEVAGEINFDDGIYYIVLDADGNPADGPGDDILFWEDNYYYIKLEDGFFDFTQVEEGSPELDLTDYLYSENKLRVTIALSDLGSPSSIDINVITTDSENLTYDSLDEGYFTINAKTLGSMPDIFDDSGDSQGGADFDIINVTAEIATL